MKSLLSMIALVAMSFIVGSCDSELRVVVPDVSILDDLHATRSMTVRTGLCLQGVYAVDAGNDRIGDTVVVLFNGKGLSIFSAKNAVSIIVDCGVNDSMVIGSGYWRYAHSAQTGLCTIRVLDTEGGRELVNETKSTSTVLRGVLGSATEPRGAVVTLHYVRDVHHGATDFAIIAHRGGGRNSDRLPFSENSAELIAYAAKLGATGVEIDVRLTKDGVPVLYHDENLNTRLVDGEYMVGAIGNYTYAQLQTFCRLKNGEHIPTLERALSTVVDSTNLQTVWLDVKEASSLEKVITLQQDAMKRAAMMYASGKRDSLEVLVGLASADVYDAFMKRTDHQSIASVCELGNEQTMQAGSRVYGPRWTLGTLRDVVAQLHAMNKRAFVWTLDTDDFILQFIRTGTYDGILSNYPGLVAYYYYVQP